MRLNVDKLTALAFNDGYAHNPSLSAFSAVFLLSACDILRNKNLWQASIDPLSLPDYEYILKMIEQCESELMQSRIGEIFASVTIVTDTSVLLLDGSSYPVADYPLLFNVVPSAWVVGSNIVLPDTTDMFMQGKNLTAGIVTGSNSVTLVTDNLPPHNHTYSVTTNTIVAGGEIPTTATLSTDTPSVTGSTGSSTPVSIEPLSLRVYWYIVAR